MAEIYKGYILNEYLEAGWFLRENALFKAILDLLPDEGDTLVTAEHVHSKLVSPDELTDPVIQTDNNGRLIVGNGLAAADSLLHVWRASAGGVDAHADAVAALEDDGDLALQFLAPNTMLERILFGDVDDAEAGSIEYDHDETWMRFLVEGTRALVLDPSGYVLIDQTETLTAADTPLHLANGSAGAVAALAGTLETIESADNVYLSFLTPNSKESGLLFGDADNNNVGGLRYDHATNHLNAYAAGNLQAYFASTGLVVYDGRDIRAGGAAGLRLEEDGGNGVLIADGTGMITIDDGVPVRWGERPEDATGGGAVSGPISLHGGSLCFWLKVKAQSGGADYDVWVPCMTTDPV